MPQLHLRGAVLHLEPCGAVFWPRERTLIVADLHFEKGSNFARRGQLLPPYDTRETLERLEHALAKRHPARVICLGDSFHDPAGPRRMPAPDRARLSALAEGRDWIWVTGNHDPDFEPPCGRIAAEWRAGPLILRHEAESGAQGEISGHFHPKAAIRTRAGRIVRRCFVADSARLIMPAFGAYTGGLDVRDPAIRSLMEKNFTLWLLGQDTVHRVPGERLAG